MQTIVERFMSDMTRKMKNLVRIGRIETDEDIDLEKQRVRVKILGSNDLKTGWLPFSALRAGDVTIWAPPSAGEKVLVISELGELKRGVVISFLHSADNPPPSTDRSKTIISISGKETITFSIDKESGTVETACKAASINTESFEVTCKTAKIRNEKCELISEIAKALNAVANSQTLTSMGPQYSQQAFVELPKTVAYLKSFGGQDA